MMRNRKYLAGSTGRSNAQSPRRPRAGLSATKERWDDFVDGLREGMRERRNVKRPPYDKIDAFLKREVYAFVLEQLKKPAEGSKLKQVLEDVIFDHEKRLPANPSFSANPFHWAFSALQHEEQISLDGVRSLKRYQVSRFARQLEYAQRHDIPPDLLPGFLFQVGSPDEVYQKAGRHGHEGWRETYIAWLTSWRRQNDW